MIIKTDPDGKRLITEMCDLALKQGGIANLPPVTAVLNSIELLPPEPEGEPDKGDEDGEIRTQET